jgi:hypothetical protein
MWRFVLNCRLEKEKWNIKRESLHLRIVVCACIRPWLLGLSIWDSWIGAERVIPSRIQSSWLPWKLTVWWNTIFFFMIYSLSRYSFAYNSSDVFDMCPVQNCMIYWIVFFGNSNSRKIFIDKCHYWCQMVQRMKYWDFKCYRTRLSHGFPRNTKIQNKCYVFACVWLHVLRICIGCLIQELYRIHESEKWSSTSLLNGKPGWRITIRAQ